MIGRPRPWSRNWSRASASPRSTRDPCGKAGDARNRDRRSTAGRSPRVRPARLSDEPGPSKVRLHAPGTSRPRAGDDAGAGAAVARVPPLQPRGTRRDPPHLSRGRPDGQGPLSRGRAVRRDDPRAAWISADGPRSRIEGRHRSRRLLVPRRRQVRICRAIEGPGPPRSKAGLPLGPRSRVLLRGPVRGSHRANQRIWSPRSADPARGLAALSRERLGCGTGADPVPTPAVPELRRAVSTVAREISPIQGAVPGSSTGLLPQSSSVALGRAHVAICLASWAGNAGQFKGSLRVHRPPRLHVFGATFRKVAKKPATNAAYKAVARKIGRS